MPAGFEARSRRRLAAICWLCEGAAAERSPAAMASRSRRSGGLGSQLLRQLGDIRRNPTRLILAEQLGGRFAGLIIEIASFCPLLSFTTKRVPTSCASVI